MNQIKLPGAVIKVQRYINTGAKLLDLSIPRVMGVINVTPDSFYRKSRKGIEEVSETAGQMLSEGADIIDVGAYSTRPGSTETDAVTEADRLLPAIKKIKQEFPQAVISVDTFRASVARKAVEDCGADIINDISGGEADAEMFDLVQKLNVPYILMHMRGKHTTMQDNTHYDDVVADILSWFGKRIHRLRSAGVKDIIIDPGFGFSKDARGNFEILARLEEFKIAGLPVLAGVSRKSMIWKTLGNTPDDALNGTTVLNTIALLNGADILRVHDVKEAVEAIKLTSVLKMTIKAS